MGVSQPSLKSFIHDSLFCEIFLFLHQLKELEGRGHSGQCHAQPLNWMPTGTPLMEICSR